MRLFAKRVRVVCLGISVWCCMVCFCVLFAVFECVVLNVCGLCLVPYVRLPFFFLFLRVFACRYVFVCSVYDVSCGVA